MRGIQVTHEDAQVLGKGDLVSIAGDTASSAMIRTPAADGLAPALPPLPRLAPGQSLDIEAIRDRREGYYALAIWVVGGFLNALLLWDEPEIMVWVVAALVVIALLSMAFWGVQYWYTLGHGIEVGPNQYPHIYRVVKQACDRLELAIPRVVIVQGHGMFNIFVAKRFASRGIITITSNLMDEFAQCPDSREFMMFVGRQLGHIKAGHFRLAALRDAVGWLVFPLLFAWRRRTHFTADRVGLLVCGDPRAAERALLMLAVGGTIASATNFEEIQAQRHRLLDSMGAWFALGFSSYPFMVERIARLRSFASLLTSQQGPGQAAALQLDHFPIRSMPVLIIHGHDRLALLELKDFLYSKFPHVVPQLMVSTTAGTMCMPEKFEEVARDAQGAIALLTPDDVSAAEDSASPAQGRARQNVILEIGWSWARFGRARCLLLARGALEIPSDLSGADVYPFERSPSECSESLRAFIERLAVR
jgi:Zn-dependent protease with chaperone function